MQQESITAPEDSIFGPISLFPSGEFFCVRLGLDDAGEKVCYGSNLVKVDEDTYRWSDRGEDKGLESYVHIAELYRRHVLFLGALKDIRAELNQDDEAPSLDRLRYLADEALSDFPA